MNKKFATSWKSSVKPVKQRRYRRNAPLHIKQKLMGAHLSPELRKKHGLRTLPLKKSDKVTIVRGQFKKQTGKIERVDLKKGKVFITKMETAKKDGTKTMYPFEPSNLMITELNLDDKKRIKSKKAEKSGTDEVKVAPKAAVVTPKPVSKPAVSAPKKEIPKPEVKNG